MLRRAGMLVLGGLVCLGVQGRLDAAVSPTRAERMVAQVSSEVALLLWVKTDDYAHRDDERALALVRMVVELDPSFEEAYSVLATYSRSNREAGEIYRVGLAANPNSAQLNFEYGYFYMAVWTKNPTGGIPYVRKAVAAAPDKTQKAKFLHVLAHLYRETGQVGQAIATWEEALRLDPNDPIAQRELRELRASRAGK